MNILKKFAPRLGKKGSRPGGSPNSLGNNEHSGKALWPKENHTFESGSTVFHFLSLSFIFFHCLSFSFIFPLFFSLLVLLVLLFSRVLKIFFFPRLPHDFLLKLLCKKSIFWAVSGGTPLGPFCVLLSILMFFFHFRFRFQFLFMLFLFFFCFSFFHSLFLYFFVFLGKKVSSFFSAQNLWRHSRIPWGKVHILSWLYLLCIGSSSLFHVEYWTFW